MPFNKVFLRLQKLVSTKTLLLKHYYRRQEFKEFEGEGGCGKEVRKQLDTWKCKYAHASELKRGTDRSSTESGQEIYLRRFRGILW